MATKLSGGRANSWHGLMNIRMFYWPALGLHEQQAFLLDDDRSSQLGGSRANGVMAEHVWYLSSFTQSMQEKRARTWRRVPCCVALGQPLPLSKLRDLPVKGKVNPRQRVETMLLPSHFQPTLAFSLIPEDPKLRGYLSQGAPSS